MYLNEEQPKLTDWENEPTLEALKKDFRASKQFHDNQLSKINHWQDLLYVKGTEQPASVKGRSKVQPKLIRRQAEWRYSALSEPFLSSDRIFQVNPRTFEDADAARQNQLLLNYQFDTKINKVDFIDKYIRTVVDEGTAIVRLGWERVTKEVEEQVPTYQFIPVQSKEEQEQLEQAVQLKQSNPRMFNEQVPDEIKEAVKFYEESQQPVVAYVSGSQIVPTEKIIENKPVIELVNPANVFIDPSCQGEMDKAMYIVVSYETSKAELVKTGLYQNLDKVNWDENLPQQDSDHVSSTPDEFSSLMPDKFRRRVVAYEYWGFYDINKTGELVPIVATWIGSTMIRMAENPFPDGKLPFVFVPYLPVKRSVYGEPDAELLEDNQHILGAVTRGMIDLLGKSANSQQGFAKGFLDPVQKRRFESGQDYEFNPGVFTPQTGYLMHTYPEAPQSSITMLQLQNQEAEALTGVKSFSGGVSGEAYGQVAAGIRGALDAASKREMAILRRLAKGLAEIGNKIISMDSEFLSDEEVIRVTNKEFISIKRDDIKGNFDLTVDISTAEIDNNKAQDLGFMLQTLGPSMDMSVTLLILSQIAELKRMPELAEKIRTYKPQPDPLEEQRKQLEIAKLQSEINLNNARAAAQQADAENVKIDSIQNVDGTKHIRDMEKQQAQAQGNQDLEIVKAFSKTRKIGEQAPDLDGAIGYNLSKKALKQIADAKDHYSFGPRDKQFTGNGLV